MSDLKINLVELARQEYTEIENFVYDFNLDPDFTRIFKTQINEYLADTIDQLSTRELLGFLLPVLTKRLPKRQGYTLKFNNNEQESIDKFEIVLYTALNICTTDKPLVGWQVVDVNNDMPKDMWSFCIYDLTYCMSRLEEDKWKLLPIYHQDIEEPTDIDAFVDIK